MVMTLQSFNAEDRILNQTQREDLFFNMAFIDTIARTRPIIIMDEPLEGMDTENAVARIDALKPLCRLRYSATHKVMRNLVYRLTPFDSYQQGLVKKIEVLTVAEQNQEATLRVELVKVKTYQDGRPPRAKLRLWYAKQDGSFASRESPFLKVGDDLEKKTGNVGYRGYDIRRISKPLRGSAYRCEFENGTIVVEKEKAADKYRQVYREKMNCEPGEEEIAAVQGYYFAKTARGEYTDNERSMRTKKALRASEVYKIKCAMKHFHALGVDAQVNYDAPVKEYSVFKTRANGVTHA